MYGVTFMRIDRRHFFTLAAVGAVNALSGCGVQRPSGAVEAITVGMAPRGGTAEERKLEDAKYKSDLRDREREGSGDGY
jgi:hypothetical protein